MIVVGVILLVCCLGIFGAMLVDFVCRLNCVKIQASVVQVERLGRKYQVTVRYVVGGVTYKSVLLLTEYGGEECVDVYVNTHIADKVSRVHYDKRKRNAANAHLLALCLVLFALWFVLWLGLRLV